MASLKAMSISETKKYTHSKINRNRPKPLVFKSLSSELQTPSHLLLSNSSTSSTSISPLPVSTSSTLSTQSLRHSVYDENVDVDVDVDVDVEVEVDVDVDVDMEELCNRICDDDDVVCYDYNDDDENIQMSNNIDATLYQYGITCDELCSLLSDMIIDKQDSVEVRNYDTSNRHDMLLPPVSARNASSPIKISTKRKQSATNCVRGRSSATNCVKRRLHSDNSIPFNAIKKHKIYC